MCKECGCGRPNDEHTRHDGTGVIQNMEKVQGEPLNNQPTQDSKSQLRRGKPGMIR
jgi:hypothetical protein